MRSPPLTPSGRSTWKHSLERLVTSRLQRCFQRSGGRRLDERRHCQTGVYSRQGRRYNAPAPLRRSASLRLCGGIGRRDGFKIRCPLRASRFDSGQSHIRGKDSRQRPRTRLRQFLGQLKSPNERPDCLLLTSASATCASPSCAGSRSLSVTSPPEKVGRETGLFTPSSTASIRKKLGDYLRLPQPIWTRRGRFLSRMTFSGGLLIRLVIRI